MRSTGNQNRSRAEKLLSTAAVLLGMLFILCIIMIMANSGGRIRSAEEPGIVASSLIGQTSILRRGAGYRLKEGIALTEEDGIMTTSGARASFAVRDCGTFTMNENSEAAVETDSPETACIMSVYGTLFCETAPGGRTLLVDTPAGILTAGADTLFSVETYHGTQTFKIYRGSAVLSSGALSEDILLSSGDMLQVYQDDDGKCTYDDIEPIPIQSMSGFLIDMLMSSDGDKAFSPAQLEAESLRREQEVERARAERAEYEAAIIAQGGTVPVIESTKPLTEYMTEADLHTCTVTIMCGTILDNMEDLAAGKSVYVPANGVILATSTVQYVVGETVFDVLKRACAAADIPLQYSWTVEFGGYYVEGINELCEFDCGPESGWMYKVNGWFPNYGSSNYILSDGDIIVWAYTCRGLGADLGLEWQL